MTACGNQVFEDAQGEVLERFGPESQATVEKWERDGKEYPFGILCVLPLSSMHAVCEKGLGRWRAKESGQGAWRSRRRAGRHSGRRGPTQLVDEEP